MLHQCLDCTYKGQLFPGGACPACGSFRLRKVAAEKPPKPMARVPFRLLLAVALWLYLIVEVYKRLA